MGKNNSTLSLFIFTITLFGCHVLCKAARGLPGGYMQPNNAPAGQNMYAPGPTGAPVGQPPQQYTTAGGVPPQGMAPGGPGAPMGQQEAFPGNLQGQGNNIGAQGIPTVKEGEPIDFYKKYRQQANDVKTILFNAEKEQDYSLRFTINFIDSTVIDACSLKNYTQDPELLGLNEEVILVVFALFNAMLEEFKNRPYDHVVPTSPIVGMDSVVDHRMLEKGDAMDGQLSSDFEIVQSGFKLKKQLSDSRRLLVQCFPTNQIPPETIQYYGQAYTNYFNTLVPPQNQGQPNINKIETFSCDGGPGQLTQRVYLIRRRFSYYQNNRQKPFTQLQTLINDQSGFLRMGFSDKALIVFKINRLAQPGGQVQGNPQPALGPSGQPNNPNPNGWSAPPGGYNPSGVTQGGATGFTQGAAPPTTVPGSGYTQQGQGYNPGPYNNNNNTPGYGTAGGYSGPSPYPQQGAPAGAAGYGPYNG